MEDLLTENKIKRQAGKRQLKKETTEKKKHHPMSASVRKTPTERRLARSAVPEHIRKGLSWEDWVILQQRANEGRFLFRKQCEWERSLHLGGWEEWRKLIALERVGPGINDTHAAKLGLAKLNDPDLRKAVERRKMRMSRGWRRAAGVDRNDYYNRRKERASDYWGILRDKVKSMMKQIRKDKMREVYKEERMRVKETDQEILKHRQFKRNIAAGIFFSNCVLIISLVWWKCM